MRKGEMIEFVRKKKDLFFIVVLKKKNLRKVE